VTRRRSRTQRGATIVEAALVIPLVFLFLLTTIDLADWAFQASQANGAARDGARVGVLHYQSADTAGSQDTQYITTAVGRRLAGQTDTLTAQCIQPHATTALSHGCGPAIPGCDRIQVKVVWPRTPWSPIGKFFGTATVHGEADMTIVGVPLTTGATIGTVDATGCP